MKLNLKPKLKLVHKNSEILRVPAKPVTNKQGRDRGRRLLSFLRSINRQKISALRAIGIAAPQVGWDMAVCVCSFPAYSVGSREFILVNPKIISFDTTTIEDVEQCLSLPGESYIVVRSIRVQVQADNFNEILDFGPKAGEIWTPDKLLEARCVQHEIDHLRGVLISDIGQPTKL